MGKPKETWGSTKKHRETQGSIGKGWGSTMLYTKMGTLMEQNFINVFSFFFVHSHFNIHVYA
jgi:hypothetical protein